MRVIYTPGPDELDPLTGDAEPLRYLDSEAGELHDLAPGVAAEVPDHVAADLLDADGHRVEKA